MTYHDPCQIARRGGVVQQPRNLLHEVAADFVEMPEAGSMNWCCGAGGGVSANERADEIRLKAFNRKKKQLDQIHPDAIVSACSNCRIHLEDGLEENHMDIPVLSLTETIVVAEEPYRMEYTATGVPGTRFYHGFVTLEPTPAGATKITWEAQFRSPLPGAGRLTSATLRTLVKGLAAASEQIPSAG